MIPFVWFVHEKLGLSGYGFSVDDDTADVGANGSNHLQMSIGGLGQLSNPLPWTAVGPYGPVSTAGTLTTGGKTITGLEKGTQVDKVDFASGTVTLNKPLAKSLKGGSYGYTFT